MKKAVKSTLIWGTTVAVAAGIAVAIAVPVTNAKNKVTNTSPTAGILDTTEVADGITVAQTNKALEKTDTVDTTKMSKAQYQLSAFLYEKERVGSKDLQLLYFTWDQYVINKSLKNVIKNDLSTTVADVTDATEAQFKKLMGQARDLVKDALSKITGSTAADDEEKAKYNNISSKLDEQERSWNNKNTLIDNLKNNKYDETSTSFSSDYPKMLISLDAISKKQGSIYDETKKSFVASYSTASAGEAEWQKQLSSKYGGATSRETAIEYLVNQQISSSAWNKFKYSINSDFTYEQFKSGIFEPILGKADGSENKVKVNSAANLSLEANGQEKVYFFGTASKIPALVNASGNIAGSIPGASEIVRINNAILGFKQDTTDAAKAWTVTKDQLKSLFSYIANPASGDANIRPVDQWQNVFSGNAEITKALVAYASATTDSTQFRSGDLGYTTKLAALKGYYSGFALGAAAAFDDQDSSYNLGGAIDASSFPSTVYTYDSTQTGTRPEDKIVGSTSRTTNFVGYVMDQMKRQLLILLVQKGRTPLADLVSRNTGDAQDVNTQLTAFIDKLTDDEIARTFGMAVRSAFVDSWSAKPVNGLPSAIKIAAGVYIVYSEEAGIHIIKVAASSADAQTKLGEELQAAADKQDSKQIITDWATFVNTYLSQARELDKVLTDAATKDEAEKWLNDHYKELGYTDSNKGDVLTDIRKLVDAQLKAEKLARIQAAYRSDMYSWLQKQIDNKLWSGDTSKTIQPEEIYEAVRRAGGL